MAIPSNVRQRRWRERQKHKKQVTIMMSKAAYELLKKRSKIINANFSSIVDEAILGVLKPVNRFKTKGEEESEKKNCHSDDMTELFKKNPRVAYRKLRKEIAILRQQKELLLEERERFQLILNNCHDTIWLVNSETHEIEYVTPSSEAAVGIPSDELKGHKVEEFFTYLHPDDRKEFEKIIKNIHNSKKLNKADHTFEYRTIHPKLGEYRWVTGSRTLGYNHKNELVGVVLTTRDIHRRKQAELALGELRDELQRKVKKRTASLEEANIALTHMLKKEYELKAKLEGNILSSLNELIIPYLEKLKKSRLDVRQKNYIDIMESNLNKVVSPFSRKLSSSLLGLTPTEIQVADLIRKGKNTKEIADLLNLSIRTIDFHRTNIRKKIGIKNKKVSLSSYLMSFE